MFKVLAQGLTPSHLRLRNPLNRAGRLHRVMQQAGNRHRPHAAGHGGDGAGHFFARRKITIAHQNHFPVALNAVDAHVDHSGPSFKAIAIGQGTITPPWP